MTIVAGALVLGGCVVQAPAPPPVTVTVEAQPTQEPQTVAEPTTRPAEPTPTTPEPTGTPASEPEVFTMPSVTGMNLQLAQDTLQAVGS